jgi:hypothetical protein
MVHHPFRALAFCLLAATAACGTSEARATGSGAETNATAVPPAQVAPPAPLSAAEIALAGSPVMDVYMSPTCGCCGDWVDHMREGGFTVNTHLDVDVGAKKTELGVPLAISSCHTGVVDGYVVEGHVPAEVVRKLLAERPDARGVTTPGMPIGSPGMEMGNRKDAYDVLLMLRDGRTSVYASYHR